MSNGIDSEMVRHLCQTYSSLLPPALVACNSDIGSAPSGGRAAQFCIVPAGPGRYRWQKGPKSGYWFHRGGRGIRGAQGRRSRTQLRWLGWAVIVNG